MSVSTSGGRSSSPFQHRRQSSHYSSSSSSSSLMNGRLVPTSSSSSVAQFLGSGSAYSSRSVTPSQHRSDSMYTRGYEEQSPVDFASSDDFIEEPLEAPRQGADSISVTIRFRPLSEREYLKGDEIAWSPDGDILVRNEYNLATSYAFDRVFGPSATSPEVYEVAARPVVKAAMEGINGTVFAYGVTSSGKTYTMHGDQSSPGIIPLAIKDVFSIIQDTPGREFLLRVSYLEIYNEVINDLLDPTGQNLRVREDAQGTYVEGIKEEVVLSPGHALSFIAAGEEHRHVGSNNFNLFSSRSHTIFTLMIESSDRGDEYDGVIFSHLNLIDLAGSESSKTETTGLRRKEGSYINKSLLTLGTVIGKLSEGRASHIPFRDSKLTRLLQTSLSGHGLVSLICTVTPASSNMEETHNTLKFANRAKCVEIYASCNKIMDEKSLIKKYQREISTLKEELDNLRRGMVAGGNHEEIMILRQQLEEGQVKMQTRLEEEEEAKAALISRIQRLTKLILVSSKQTIPTLNDMPGHQRSHSAENDKLEVLRDSLLFESASTFSNDFKHKRSSSKWTDDLSAAGGTTNDATQRGELPKNGMTMSDEMDLLVEQVKMLADEIAFRSSTLKRLVEQSVNDPAASKLQIQNMEHEIEEKRRQMRVLEQRIVENDEASVANASLVDMQQTVMRLMTQCNEKSFELEIKSADNRVLQEQFQNKCAENKELQDRIAILLRHRASTASDKLSSLEKNVPEGLLQDLKKKVQSQEIENEKMKLERVQILEENSGLRVQNQKISEEASYAKELASAAAVELKNLAGEITKISLQNAKLEKDLAAAKELLAHSKGASMGNGNNRKHSDSYSRSGRRGRTSVRPNGGYSVATYDDFDSWELDPSDMKMELQARKQREAVLESALAEKEIVEDEYRKKVEEGKKREAALENDLANMWVLVAQLKKESVAATAVASVAAPAASPQLMSTNDRTDQNVGMKTEETKTNANSVLKEMQVNDAIIKPAQEISKEESLVVRLKARMQEMKEKELKYSGGNGDANSHTCKVCFESPTATMLLPCRHFCLCKSCSQACIECPICRTKITDRIFAFT